MLPITFLTAKTGLVGTLTTPLWTRLSLLEVHRTTRSSAISVVQICFSTLAQEMNSRAYCNFLAIVSDKWADGLLGKDIRMMQYTMPSQGVAHRYSPEDTAEWVAHLLWIAINNPRTRSATLLRNPSVMSWTLVIMLHSSSPSTTLNAQLIKSKSTPWALVTSKQPDNPFHVLSPQVDVLFICELYSTCRCNRSCMYVCMYQSHCKPVIVITISQIHDYLFFWVYFLLWSKAIYLWSIDRRVRWCDCQVTTVSHVQFCDSNDLYLFGILDKICDLLRCTDRMLTFRLLLLIAIGVGDGLPSLTQVSLQVPATRESIE